MEDNFPTWLTVLMLRLSLLIKLLVFILLAGCEERIDQVSSGSHVLDSIDLALITKTVDRFEEVVNDHSRRSVISIEAFHLSVENFLENPSIEHRQQMKDLWLKAHDVFLAASFFTFTDQSQNIFQIDAWPIQEGFLDSLPDYPQSGIVNDVTVAITEVSIRAQHGITHVQEVSLGFHALEYLIFGRAIDDFSISDDELKVRRRQTLDIVTELLKQDINSMFAETDGAHSDFRSNLVENNASTVLKLMIQRLHAKVQILLAEANHIDNENFGHSRFSGSSWSNLSAQVRVLGELTGEQTAIDRVFTLLDQKTSADYRLTLSQTNDIFATDDADEEQLARVTLLFTALGHQLGDFQIVLQNSAH